MHLSAAENALNYIASNKPQASIVDPLIADKILREKIVEFLRDLVELAQTGKTAKITHDRPQTLLSAFRH